MQLSLEKPVRIGYDCACGHRHVAAFSEERAIQWHECPVERGMWNRLDEIVATP